MKSIGLDKEDINQESNRIQKSNHLNNPFDFPGMHNLIKHEKIKQEFKYSEEIIKTNIVLIFRPPVDC